MSATATKQADLRIKLGGVSTPAMRGDNLAIVLASYFEPHVDDEELDDSGTWKQGAIDAANEVLGAIHAHYTPSPTWAPHPDQTSPMTVGPEQFEENGYDRLFGPPCPECGAFRDMPCAYSGDREGWDCPQEPRS